jgi:hypothetical protein
MKNRIVISAVIVALFFALVTVANANANVYVKVDANGVAVDGPIMCDSGTCGAGSEFSRLTLKEGERYVLQGTGSAGIGGNNPNTQVKVDLQTNDWTITRQIEVKPVEPVVINEQKVISYTVEVKETFNPITNPPSWQPAPQPIISIPTPDPRPTLPPVETRTATVETRTATVDTSTVSVLRSVSAMPQMIIITRDKNGKLIITKKPKTVKVRKAVKR